MVPERSRAPDRGRMIRAQLMTSSMVMLPLCWTGKGQLAERRDGGGLTVLDLLSVSEGLLEGLDDHRGSGGNDGDLDAIKLIQ